MIRSYLSDIINDYRTQGEWKSQLKTLIDFISFKDSDETRTMHRNIDNIKNMIGSEIDEIIEELFESLLQKYQKDLEESIRGSEFIFDSVDLFYYKLNKVGLNRGRSYIDSPEWLKNEKATINTKNNNDKCFQFTLTVALNHKQIKIYPERILKLKPFIDQYHWKNIT